MRFRSLSRLKFVPLLAAALLLQGCVTYLTPGPAAPMRDLTEGTDWNLAASRKPVAQFPVRLAIVHLQSGGYRSFGARGFGDGDFSVVDVREVERPEDLDAMMDWPQVFGTVPLNRTLMPATLKRFDDLRDAARAAQADVVFAYTFETRFFVENRSFTPDQEITLGVLPGREARVSSTASGLFVDAVTGFVYGLAEGSGSERASMTQWTKPSAADDTRIKAERQAFTQLMTNAAGTWKRIVNRYAGVVPAQFDVPTPDTQRNDVTPPEAAPTAEGAAPKAPPPSAGSPDAPMPDAAAVPPKAVPDAPAGPSPDTAPR